jgi:hypothetical protein
LKTTAAKNYLQEVVLSSEALNSTPVFALLARVFEKLLPALKA